MTLATIARGIVNILIPRYQDDRVTATALNTAKTLLLSLMNKLASPLEWLLHILDYH